MSAPLAHPGPYLGDGCHTCSYADLPARQAAVADVLARAGVAGEECVALHGGNDLTSVVTLLSLLERGVGFVLCGGSQPAPAFCRHAVYCGSPPAASSGWAIESGLRVEPNPAWRDTHVSYRSRFYARTSGTTAEARIVLYTQDKLWANARHCAERFRLSDQDRVAIPVPVWHMYGLAAALLPAVLAKASVDVQADSNILRYLQRETEVAPTTTFLTPTFCYALTRVRQATRRYRLTVAAGDKTPPEIFERYERAHGCLVSLYGSTELGAVAAGSPDDAFDLRCHSTGRPMPGVVVSEGGEGPPSPGGLAELWFTHPAGGEGYADERGEVDATDERFSRGRFRSRDLGRLDGDGCLRVAGRSDHMVKRDGILVSFIEVESALLKNPAVEAAVVLSDGTTPRGARLTAVCVGRGAEATAIREEARKHLAGHALPDRVVLIGEIPRLPSGKPDRAALLEYLASREG
jgi:acyl-CoA synthetase (AMP-forming)/AMP-acid ligase II